MKKISRFCVITVSLLFATCPLLGIADTQRDKRVVKGITERVCQYSSVPLVIGVNSCGKKLCHGRVKCTSKKKITSEMNVVCMAEKNGCPSVLECMLQNRDNVSQRRKDFSILPASNLYIEDGLVKNKYHGFGKFKPKSPPSNSLNNSDSTQ